MSHISIQKKRLITRLHRIKGQADAMERALSENVECGVFLHQIASMRGAMDGLLSEVLEGHIREHLGELNADPVHRAEDLDQVIGVLKTYLK